MTTKAQSAPAEQREYLLSLFDEMDHRTRQLLLAAARQVAHVQFAEAYRRGCWLCGAEWEQTTTGRVPNTAGEPTVVAPAGADVADLGV